jgi:hypothetical protein
MAGMAMHRTDSGSGDRVILSGAVRGPGLFAVTRGPLGKLIIDDEAIELGFHGPRLLYRLFGLTGTRVLKTDGGRVVVDMDPRWGVPRYRLSPQAGAGADAAAFYPLNETHLAAVLARFGWPVCPAT